MNSFFEGPEKKVELAVVDEFDSLRAFGSERWTAVVEAVEGSKRPYQGFLCQVGGLIRVVAQRAGDAMEAFVIGPRQRDEARDQAFGCALSLQLDVIPRSRMQKQ